MSSWHSYPSIYNVGHAALAGFFDRWLNVEEKIDGSQFSFGVFDGEIKVRSKGKEMNVDSPEKMFAEAVEVVKYIAPALHDGWTYRGEYLQKPKHNALAYSRIPRNHIIIFDVNVEDEHYLSYADKEAEAHRIGLECVPLVATTREPSVEDFEAWLSRESVLGGQKIEGVVLKPLNYDVFGRDKKCLMAKHVSEAFKEKHRVAWKVANPKQGDVIERIISTYAVEARWRKAVQHLREAGRINDSPSDIGALIQEIPADVLKECEAEMKAALWAWAWQHIKRGLTRGFPEWYKQELLAKQCGNGNAQAFNNNEQLGNAEQE